MIETRIETSEETRGATAPGSRESAGEAAGALGRGPSSEKRSRARGLLAIGLFKLSKATFFFAVGIGALHLIHTNVGDLMLRMTRMLHLDPDWRFVEILQDKVDLLTGHQLRNAAMLSCGYALLSLVEGIGLMMEQTWAEYLTLVLTICALPWEVFELFKHGTPIRAVVLVVNLGVLAYLLWFIRWHRRMLRDQAA